MENRPDTEFKQCPDCLGIGQDDTSNCCGAPMQEDWKICKDCKEHADFTPCDTCNGDGEIEMTEEDIRERDNDNELDAGDQKMDLED